VSKLETVANQYADREYEVHIRCPEFTCVCPRTGQPDFATIEIRYVPAQKIVELKSLKLYLETYRSEGVFHEHVTNQILDDFVEASDPIRCEVTGDFNVRGGIKTVVRSQYERPLT
jgi:7-cyano-7-deazaguanine reductase